MLGSLTWWTFCLRTRPSSSASSSREDDVLALSESELSEVMSVAPVSSHSSISELGTWNGMGKHDS